MNVILKIAYDGTEYAGWQKQKNAKSIQGVLDKLLSELFNREINTIGAGRTDAGVHSVGQIANFSLDKIPRFNKDKLFSVLNEKLPRDIGINGLWYYDGDFNSRFDAIGRQYKYTIITKKDVFDNRYKTFIKYPIKFYKLKEIEHIFLGEKDFTAFSKRNPSTKNYTCNVQYCSWKWVNDNKFWLRIRADRFVYGMVRSIVGAMVDYARERKFEEDLIDLFETKSKDNFSPKVDAQGLLLEKIYYPDKYDFLNK